MLPPVIMTAAQFAVLFLVAGIVAGLLLLARGRPIPQPGTRDALSSRMTDRQRGVSGKVASVDQRSCPLCGEGLGPGERLRTRVFEIQRHGGSIEESFVHIFGCPHCDAREQTRHNARCPSCRRELQPGEVVFARLFMREGHKDHLRVLGCSGCRPQARLQAGAARGQGPQKPDMKHA